MGRQILVVILCAASLALGITCGMSLPAARAVPPCPTTLSLPRGAGRVLFHVTGTTNKQTDAFHVAGRFTLRWDARLQDTAAGSGYLSIEVHDDRSDDLLDLAANTTQPGPGATREHAPCAHGCYLDISALNMAYTITGTP